MYVTNVDELVEALKPKLQQYLETKIGDEVQKKKFKCYVHEDSTPSMAFNPKTGNTTVHCFGCGITHDIFSAYSYFESMPNSGPEWVTQTLPSLAEELGVEVQLGKASARDTEKLKLYKLASDITSALESTDPGDYPETRGWDIENLSVGRISPEALNSHLRSCGWSPEDILTSGMVKLDKNRYFFGEDLFTFVIKDYRSRPVAFISRNLKNQKPKYINTKETEIYSKSQDLFGIDVALRKGKATRLGLYVVEGTGDVAALHSIGVYNVVATCGVAFTSHHLALLKMLNVKNVFFMYDWDQAGRDALERIFKNELRLSPGINCWVVESPKEDYKDPGEFLFDKTREDFYKLKRTQAFEWLLKWMKKDSPPDVICAEMIPVIASEATHVRREILMQVLSDTTGISFNSILSDVSSIRDNKFEERKERLKTAADRFGRNVQEDPTSISGLLGQLEKDIEYIEKEYERDLIGPSYQLSRYEAIQERLMSTEESQRPLEFTLKNLPELRQALSGGLSWAEGCLVYVGGRANSGKTATVISIASDVLLHDKDAIVLAHFTDDSYVQVEPRFKINIAQMIKESWQESLSIGMVANPMKNIKDQGLWDLYQQADSIIRNALKNERLILMDSEDGNTLTVVERNLKYLRQRYPDKKIFVVCDNTHNYMDFMQHQRTERMTLISNYQKMLTMKYRCCMFATAEYRKDSSSDRTKLRMPVDDDLADARALTYRPNLIIHVYNDLNDRREHAEICWVRPGSSKPLPRLVLVLSKNKISSFKDKLSVDLDPYTLTISSCDTEKARIDTVKFKKLKEDGGVKVNNGQLVIEADWE